MSLSIHAIINEAVKLPLVVCGMGTQEQQCSITREEGYPLHQLIFSTKGTGILKTTQGEFTIKEGDFFYLKPNEFHSYQQIDGPWSTSWILFKCHYPEMLKTLNFADDKVGQLNLLEWSSIFYDMMSSLQRESLDSAQLASSQLYHLLVLLNKLDCNSIENHNTAHKDLLKPVIDYMDKNYSEQISLDFLAGLINITEPYFCTVFKEVYAMRPFEYLTKKRLQASKKMLLETTLSIHEISKRVGYNDNSYFGAVFKKHEQITPSLYRGNKK